MPETRKQRPSPAQRRDDPHVGARRKQLGQYFTGLRLGKLLAQLAINDDCRSILDPMAGNGDLLEAAWGAAILREARVTGIAAIEIDKAVASSCEARLSKLAAGRQTELTIISSDAFDARSIEALPSQQFDLVIANPPYVRRESRNPIGINGEAHTRSALIDIFGRYSNKAEHHIWDAVAKGYSGLADLSVPALLLAAFLVKPDGRLALVVPAAWRSREYADVIRFLLLRCFHIEYVVEDTQPGWFSDVLVRTHLIVARRLTATQSVAPLATRMQWPSSLWLHISPEAANEESLVGAAFPDGNSEMGFATWASGSRRTAKKGIAAHDFDLRGEYDFLDSRIGSRGWYRKLESDGRLPLFHGVPRTMNGSLPAALREIIPENYELKSLIKLGESGIAVGQGLRTGCNAFFYVSLSDGPGSASQTRIRGSTLLGSMTFGVPHDAVRPVLRRQAETDSLVAGTGLVGRVLDLNRYVLPEDAELVMRSSKQYAAKNLTLPLPMPDDLAKYVRTATSVSLDRGGMRRIPDLSAVRTNESRPSDEKGVPRFWYMLPQFAPRHLPQAFVARINHGLPWAEANSEPPVLVDANFSTLWSTGGIWTAFGIKALMNSTWCRTFMEALGTPFGGGALKLEAAQIRQIVVPELSVDAIIRLGRLGGSLTQNAKGIQSEIDSIVLGDALSKKTAAHISRFATALANRAQDMSSARQRAA